MYANVLLATDGSETASRATTHAIEIAREHEARLHAVYVVETRTAYDNAIVDPEIVRSNLREEGENALAGVREQAGDLAVETSIRTGIPHEELLAYMDDEKIDLVVIGSKGRSEFKTVLLGSTATAVLRSADVPVVVVGNGSTQEVTDRSGKEHS